jgi:hypothetical protein
MKMNIPNTHTGKLINLSIKSRKLGLSDWWERCKPFF